MANPVVRDGVMFGLSHLKRGQYFALDLDSGEALWESTPRQAENAALVRAGNIVFSLEEDAELVVFEAGPRRAYGNPALRGRRQRDLDPAHGGGRPDLREGRFAPPSLGHPLIRRVPGLMSRIVLLGVPDHLHREIRKAAAWSRRTVSAEILFRLEESFAQQTVGHRAVSRAH